MQFKEAYEKLKEGKLIKLPSWDGYWKWENDTIMMYCKDDTVIDIRATQMVDYTINNILSDEWEIADKNNCALLQPSHGLEWMIGMLKTSKKVCRRPWLNNESENKYLFLDTANRIKLRLKNGLIVDYLLNEDTDIYDGWIEYKGEE